MDRKTIAQCLDNAAARTEMVGGTPATPKQCWYLAGLLVGDEAWRADAYLDSNAMLSKRAASALIDELLRASSVAEAC